MTQTSAIFTPADEQQADEVLACLADPDCSLSAIARRCNTTVPALTAWMTRPEIAARLDALESALARRLRLQVADTLPAVAHALTQILRDALNELTHPASDSTSTPRTPEQRHRTRESARKAASLLVRLATFRGGPAPQPRPRRDPGPTNDNNTSDDAPRQRQAPPLEDQLNRLAAMGLHIELYPSHAGDEAPPQPPAPSTSTPTPEGRCAAHPRVSPSPEPPHLDAPPRASSPSHRSHQSPLNGNLTPADNPRTPDPRGPT